MIWAQKPQKEVCMFICAKAPQDSTKALTDSLTLSSIQNTLTTPQRKTRYDYMYVTIYDYA